MGFDCVADSGDIEKIHQTTRKLIQWGEGLFAYSSAGSARESKSVLVLDIGSGSVKAIVYNCTENVPQPVDGAHLSEKCSLGGDIKIGDTAAKLNSDGLATYYKHALTRCKNLIDSETPDTILVLCTAAIREAQKNPQEQKTIENFISETANKLGIPKKCINIVDETMEARLAALGVFFASPKAYGHSITIGGNSTELATLFHGRIARQRLATLPIGRNSLSQLSPAQLTTAIEAAFLSASWFEQFDDKATLYLQGGTFRLVGRLVAQRINHADIQTKIPFDGYTFANTIEFIETLQALQNLTPDQLMDESLKLKFRSEKSIKHSAEPIEYLSKYQEWKSDFINARNTYNKWYTQWNKRIGERAQYLQAAIQVALIGIEKTKPRAVNFGNHSIREGSLIHAGVC